MSGTSKNQNKSNNNLEKYLEFTLGEENYLIPLLKVREVIAVPETTEIPNSPNYFVGIMNLRGQVISVIDIGMQLLIKCKRETSENAVIIVDLGSTYVGIIVDSVNTVLSISEEKISDFPSINEKKERSYIKGVFRSQHRMALVIDVRSALGINDLNMISDNDRAA